MENNYTQDQLMEIELSNIETLLDEVNTSEEYTYLLRRKDELNQRKKKNGN